MAKTRRRNDDIGDDLARELYSLLRETPWWVGPIVMVLAWLALAYFLPWVIGFLPAGPFGESFASTLATLSRQFAWVAPLLVGGMWVVALFQKALHGKLLTRQQSLEDVRLLDWRTFETLLAEAYRRRGYSVEETVSGADGGVDLVLVGREAGHRVKVFVQCKHWQARQVGVKVVRELAGVVAAAGGQAGGVRGVVVSSGTFTEEALRFAEQAGVELVDGESLMRLLADVRGGAALAQPVAPAPVPSPRAVRPAPSPSPVARTAPRAAAIDVPGTFVASKSPACPRCGAAMVRRVAGKGPNAGGAFWGCPKFPACRGVRSGS